MPVVDLVDVAENHLVLSLHALRECGLLQGGEIAVDDEPEVPHVILLRLDQLRDDESTAQRDGFYNRRTDGCYNRRRNRWYNQLGPGVITDEPAQTWAL